MLVAVDLVLVKWKRVRIKGTYTETGRGRDANRFKDNEL